MSQQRPPAGWYDDPSGNGGRRYWNGHGWTERTETGETAEGDRLPDGFMMLNGRRVPLGQMTTPAPARSQRRGFFVASAIALGLVLLLALLSVGQDAELDLGDWSGDDGGYAALPESTYTLEVESELGAPMDVGWYDGTTWTEESGAEGSWSVEVEAVDGTTVELLAIATDDQDVATCRIVGPDGEVVAEESSDFPGSSALCRLE